MAYSKTTWFDKIVQFPFRYTKSSETSTQVTLQHDYGTITNAGTPVNATNLNKLEQGVYDAHVTADSALSLATTANTTANAAIPKGTSNTTTAFVKTLIQNTDTRTVELIYTNGTLTQVLEKDGSTVVKTTNLNYTSGTLTSVVEIVGSTTTTTTLNYTSGSLTSVTKAVV